MFVGVQRPLLHKHVNGDLIKLKNVKPDLGFCIESMHAAVYGIVSIYTCF